jgi:hypothetical protein
MARLSNRPMDAPSRPMRSEHWWARTTWSVRAQVGFAAGLEETAVASCVLPIRCAGTVRVTKRELCPASRVTAGDTMHREARRANNAAIDPRRCSCRIGGWVLAPRRNDVAAKKAEAAIRSSEAGCNTAALCLFSVLTGRGLGGTEAEGGEHVGGRGVCLFFLSRRVASCPGWLRVTRRGAAAKS